MGLAEDLAAIRANPRLAGGVNRAVKVLTLDIETAPAVSYHFGPKQRFIGQEKNVQPGRMICFAAKWLHDKGTIFHDERAGRDEMVRAAWDLLSDADVVVGYNSTSFDIKKLNWEFARRGLVKPRPFRQVDLLRAVRAEFGADWRNLDFIATHLGVGSKMEHEGWALWRKVLDGDPAAWKRMERYNRQDVKVTEGLYLRLLPWLPGTVNLGLLAGREKACPNCGSQKLRRDDRYTSTPLTVWALYQCRDCGTWVRANYAKDRTAHRAVR